MANHPRQAGVNRVMKSSGVGRAREARKATKPQERVIAHRNGTDLRRAAGARANVEAGWSEGWPPRMTQHSLQTLKGDKPQER